MEDWIDIKRDNHHVNRERNKARELRNSSWWKSLVAQGICHYCQQKFPADELSMDHILPVVRGGKSTRGNVVPCCKECNNAKKYLTPAEMIMRAEELKMAAKERENEELG